MQPITQENSYKVRISESCWDIIDTLTFVLCYESFQNVAIDVVIFIAVRMMLFWGLHVLRSSCFLGGQGTSVL